MIADLTVSVPVVINRPVIEVFERVCDEKLVGDWFPLLQDTRITLESRDREASWRGMGPGMHIRYQLATGHAVTMEVFEFRWGAVLRYRSIEVDPRFLPAWALPTISWRVGFEPSQSGTVVTFQITQWSIMPGAVEAVRPFVTHFLSAMTHRLKQCLEQSEELSRRAWLFFSYRREDDPFGNDWLYASLKQEFGEGAIYRDIFHTRGGADVTGEIRRTIASSKVFLALIGPRWLEEIEKRDKAKGHSRRDWVLEEFGMALEMGDAICVIPVLLGDAVLPTFEEIKERRPDAPLSLSKLLERNAYRVRSLPDFYSDVSKLKESLWKELRLRSTGDYLYQRS